MDPMGNSVCPNFSGLPSQSLPLSLGLELLVIFLQENLLLLGGRHQDASATLGRHLHRCAGPFGSDGCLGWRLGFRPWDAVSVVRVSESEMLWLVFF